VEQLCEYDVLTLMAKKHYLKRGQPVDQKTQVGWGGGDISTKNKVLMEWKCINLLIIPISG